MKRKNPELNIKEIEIIKKAISIRKSKKLTQADVAKNAGVSVGFIAQFETFRQKPSEEIIKKIAVALDYPDLIEESKNLNNIKKTDSQIIALPFAKNLIRYSDDIKKQKKEYFILTDELLEFLNDSQNKNNIYAYKIKDNELFDIGMPMNSVVIIKFYELKNYTYNELKNEYNEIQLKYKNKFPMLVDRYIFSSIISKFSKNNVIAVIENKDNDNLMIRMFYEGYFFGEDKDKFSMPGITTKHPCNNYGEPFLGEASSIKGVVIAVISSILQSGMDIFFK
ncbi:MAG: helix-turn-helix domain-containing protein [bacterium]